MRDMFNHRNVVMYSEREVNAPANRWKHPRRFALFNEGFWYCSPTTHINRRSAAFLAPKNWPAWAWTECACKGRQFEMFTQGSMQHGSETSRN